MSLYILRNLNTDDVDVHDADDDEEGAGAYFFLVRDNGGLHKVLLGLTSICECCLRLMFICEHILCAMPL